MKKDSFDILKIVLDQHRDLVLSGRQVCLGIMKDYGGRDHPEIDLLAAALDEKIPIRLMQGQPVSAATIETLARDLSFKRSYSDATSKYIVSCWAGALQLFPVDASIFITPAPQTDEQTSTPSQRFNPRQPFNINPVYRIASNGEDLGEFPVCVIKYKLKSRRTYTARLLF